MRSQFVNRIIFIALLLASALASTAWADPIVITGGFVEIVGGPNAPTGNFNMLGEGFAHTGLGGDFGNANMCVTCSAGSTRSSLYAGFTGSSIGGTTLYNGVTYNVSAMNRSGVFAFGTGPVTLPTAFLESTTMTVPFTFDGWLKPDGGIPGGTGTVNLNGSGIATEELAGYLSSPGHWLYRSLSLRYDFTSGSGGGAPVPEPASLLLLASGVAGFAARRVRTSGRQ